MTGTEHYREAELWLVILGQESGLAEGRYFKAGGYLFPAPAGRIEVTFLQDPSAVLRWHYGPAAGNPDPGAMWCYGCGREVWAMEGGYICSGCGKQADS